MGYREDPRAGSRLVTLLRRLRRGVETTSVRALPSRGRAALATAYSTMVWQAVATRVSRGVDNAWVTQVYARLERVVRASFLYRWLTKEPDPEVIVIDLRETRTVGPVIALVDWVLAWSVPVARRSWVRRVLYAVGTRLRAAPMRVGGTVVLGMGVVWLVVGGVSIGVLVTLALGALALREDRSWGELTETRVAGWVQAALEPPEPPEEWERE
ncbi:MAG: hypothetical protein ACLFR6_07010 [Salinarchaeum sp.]